MDQHAIAAFVEEKLACIRQDILYHDYIKNVPVDQYCAAVDEAAFEHVSKLPLPDDVRQELNALAPADYKLCLLPSIQQACAIIDTSVLFWNYNTGDVSRLSSAQRIHHVDIIRPAESPNGVSAATPFALVVTGDKEINIYGVLSASERLDLASKPWWRANSLDTILQVTQSHNGRIFMLGSIGHIFELVIGASTLAQLVCRTTQGFLQYYLSSYILKAPTIKYKLLAVDRERKIMYTLSDNSTIQVACLDDSPGTFSLLPPLTNISDMLSDYLKERLPDSHGLPHKAITSILGTILRPRPLILVNLHVIPEETPNGIVLCAITSQGCRLYFSKTAQGALTSTTSLKLASVRVPPLNSMTNMSIMTSFCDQRGVILAEQQRLWLTKYFMVEKDKNASVQEVICDYAPEGRVFAIQLKEDNTDQNQFFDSMSQEKLRFNRQFHVLCSDGLHVYTSLQPLAMIEKTLRKTDIPLDAIKGHQRCFGELATDAIIVKLLAADQDLAAQHQQLLRTMAEERPRAATEAVLVNYSNAVKKLWKLHILTIDDQQALLQPLTSARITLEQLQQLLQNQSAFSFNEPMYNPVHHLLAQTIDTAAFIAFLFTHKMLSSHTIVDGEDLTFGELVSVSSGVLPALAERTALSWAQAQPTSDFLVGDMMRQCQALFGNYNVAFVCGSEHLERAKTACRMPQHSVSFVQSELKHSLAKFKDGVSELTLESCSQLCKEYRQLHFYEGVVLLNLHVVFNSPLVVAEHLDTHSAFEPILTLLDHANGVSQEELVSVLDLTVVQHQEKDIHTLVYRWLIINHATDVFLDHFASNTAATTYLVDFLTHSTEFSQTEYLDWLWRYHAAIGNVDLAVSCLVTLASDTPDVEIDARRFYFDKALALHPRRPDGPNQSAMNIMEIAVNLARIQTEMARLCPDNASLNYTRLELEALFQAAIENQCWVQAIILFDKKFSSVAYNTLDEDLQRKIWTSFFEKSKSLDETRVSLAKIAANVYPSIVGFPVGMVTILLAKHCQKFNAPELYSSMLIDIGIDKELVDDASQIFKKMQ